MTRANAAEKPVKESLLARRPATGMRLRRPPLAAV